MESKTRLHLLLIIWLTYSMGSSLLCVIGSIQSEEIVFMAVMGICVLLATAWLVNADALLRIVRHISYFRLFPGEADTLLNLVTDEELALLRERQAKLTKPSVSTPSPPFDR